MVLVAEDVDVVRALDLGGGKGGRLRLLGDGSGRDGQQRSRSNDKRMAFLPYENVLARIFLALWGAILTETQKRA